MGHRAVSAADLPGLVLHLDANLLVLNKPAGLAVHGGPKTPIHLEGMLDALRFNITQPPRLVHRLDRDTSGCLILARNDRAVSRLGRLFQAHLVEKTYWAVVVGDIVENQGVVDLPLLKQTDRSGWRMLADPAGQTAISDWRVLGRGHLGSQALTWLELKPRSGRTHQIRVHCATGLGCPLLGDPIYGAGDGPMHLHAAKLSIPFWADRPAILVEAPPPDHMLAALSACGWGK